jgi:N-acetylglucosaminyl-diphospho-decaprenol L-rhamnosyltransferase
MGTPPLSAAGRILAVRLSYCIVNTNGRKDLLTCLRAIHVIHPPEIDHEVLVLDNRSDDGSADAVRSWMASADDFGSTVRLIERDRRAGKSENDSLLLREAHGELCLLLNEDSELRPGAVEALIDALDAEPRAAAAGAQLLDAEGKPLGCAWRLPGIGTSIAQALFLHRLFVTQSNGSETREVGWVQSSAMLVRRRAAEEVSYLDPVFFVYSDETDFCKRLRDYGWTILFVPSALAIHHEQLATDRTAGTRRVVEYHRGRDAYMRKHHGPVAAAIARVLGAWSYLPRALAALVLPGHSARWYLLHARCALRPSQGEGMREAAEAYNRRLTTPASPPNVPKGGL